VIHGWLFPALVLLAVGVLKSEGCTAGMGSFFFGGHFIENIPMEPKKLGFLVAILFFLISLLINLLQRRHLKTRLDRIFRKEEWIFNFLEEINKNLGKVELNCTFEVDGASSPQEVGKGIHLVRNKIQSTIANIEEHLRSFRQYRRKEKTQGKKRKRLGKSHQITSGR
jgi:hypothetical protein